MKKYRSKNSMKKLTKTTLYFYCSYNKFKKQIGSYSCELIDEDDLGWGVNASMRRG